MNMIMFLGITAPVFRGYYQLACILGCALYVLSDLTQSSYFIDENTAVYLIKLVARHGAGNWSQDMKISEKD
jgi:predicted LPLAT superfamily acyltransferase